MTEQGMTLIEFEKDFAHFEQNRMYPLGYRKESVMQTLTLDHVAALSHAEMFIFPHMEATMAPRHRKQMDDDLLRLREVKQAILTSLYSPGLPFQGPELDSA